jgi:DNA polymerase-1
MKYSTIHPNRQASKRIIEKFLTLEAPDLLDEYDFLDVLNGEEPAVVLLQNFQGSFFSLEQLMQDIWSCSRTQVSDLIRIKLNSARRSMNPTSNKGLIKSTNSGRVWIPEGFFTNERTRIKNEFFPWLSTAITSVCGSFSAGKKFVQIELGRVFDRYIQGETIGCGTVVVHNTNPQALGSAVVRPVIWRGHFIRGWNVVCSATPIGTFDQVIQSERQRGSTIFIYRDPILLSGEKNLLGWSRDIVEIEKDFIQNQVHHVFVADVEPCFSSGTLLKKQSIPIWRTKKEKENNQEKPSFLCEVPAVNDFWNNLFSCGIIRLEFGSSACIEKYNLIKGKRIYSNMEIQEKNQKLIPEKTKPTASCSILSYRTKEKTKVAMTSKKKKDTSENLFGEFPEIEKNNIGPAEKKKKSAVEIHQAIDKQLEKEAQSLPDKPELSSVVSSRVEQSICLTPNKEPCGVPILPVRIDLYNKKTAFVISEIVSGLLISEKFKQSKGVIFFKQGFDWIPIRGYSESELLLHIWLIDNIEWTSGETTNLVAPLYLTPLILFRALEVLPTLTLEELPLKNFEAISGSQKLFEEDKKRPVLNLFDADIKIGGVYYLDIETSGVGEDGPLNHLKNKIELISLNDGVEGKLYSARGMSEDILKTFFEKVFSNFIVGHNLLFDLSTIYAKTGLLPEKAYDSMLAEQLILSGTIGRIPGPIFKGASLKDTLKRRLNLDVDKSEQVSDWAKEWTSEQLEYSFNDTKFLPELVVKQIEILNIQNSEVSANHVGLRNKVARLEMAMLPVCVEMTIKGIPVNLDAIELEIVTAHEKEIDRRENFLSLYPEVQNINSNVQTLKVLRSDGFDGLNLQEDTLKEFPEHIGVAALLQYKRAAQVHRNLKKYCVSVLHPNWQIIGSPPGRMSSSGPNVQNIPRYLKKIFYAPNLTLIRADYPAIELRIAAAYANERPLIDAFNSGSDPHKLTASRITGKLEENITKDERQLAKAMNYGLLYGMGAKRFQENANMEYGLNLTLDEAAEFRNKFFAAYPALKSWHNVTEKSLRQGRGIMVSTLMGRRVWHPEEDYSNALNSPIQGTSADMLKYAAVGIFSALQKLEIPEGLERPRILNLIHDEIIVVCPEKLKNSVGILVRDWMQKSAKLLLPEILTPVEVEFQEASEIGFGLK